MNYWFCPRLIVTHIRKLKRVHKLGQYSQVHKFVCVYHKNIPSLLSKGALYHKMMQYGIKLSTEHPSETNNNFVISYLKSVIFLVKSITFYNISIKIEVFCNQNSIGLKYFAEIWFGIFLVQIDRQK